MRTISTPKHVLWLAAACLVCCLGFMREAQAQSSGQQFSVSGTVIDAATKEPIIGAQVWIKDSPHGTITGLDGTYTLNFSGDYSVLSFSFLGYDPVDVRLSGEAHQTINVSMKAATQQVDEVVVVGYGTQKKVSVVGAISSVSADDLKTPAAKLSSNLAGQLSGVIAYQRSGEPGASSTFWIRGISTFGANSNPLVLVDGIERDLDLVDPEDVKEFSILKDASATAIYGVRGANGVVLVTTRSGSEGKAQISMKYEHGVVMPTKVPEVVDAVQFAEMYNDAAGYEYYSPEAIEAYRTGSNPDFYPNTDWMGAIFKNLSSSERANVSVTGGTSLVNYYVSGGFYSENGLFRSDSMHNYDTSTRYRRFNFRSNIDLKVEKNTTLNVNLATTFERKDEPGNSASDIFDRALKSPANSMPIRYSTGELAGLGANQGQNPYAMVTESGYKQYFYNNAQSLIGLTHDFGWLTPGLKAAFKFSFDAYNQHYQGRTRTAEQYGNPVLDEDGNLLLTQLVEGSQTLSFARNSYGNRRTYMEATVNYARQFGKHNVTGLFLFQQSQLNYVGDSATNSNSALPYRNQGIAGRVTYDYDSRYFFEFNAGYNGSENFSPGRRFGFFPAVAGGWLVSEEKFWGRAKNVIDMLKLKASWGLVGNDQIGGGRRFIYLETITTGNSYSFGTNAGSQSSIRLGDYANPDVGWETARKLDVGVDISFFNKLKLQIDYFNEHRTGIFLQRNAIPVYVGLSTMPYVNIGVMDNKGFDASLEYHQRIGEVELTAKGNVTFARNVIVDMDQPDWAELYMNQTGQAQWQTIGYVSDGLFQSWEDIESHADQSIFNPEPGDIKYVDLNNDGVIDSEDVKPIGWRDVPEIVYGFGLSAAWRGFDVSVFFQGNSHVNFSINTTLVRGFTASNFNLTNVLEDVYGNYWTPERPDARYPRLTTGSNTNNAQTSDYWLANGRYIRLKNAEIGYTLPKSVISKIGLGSLRVYLQGQNLFCISPFKLWDPDLQTGASAYPPTRIISLGVSVGF